MCRLVALDRNMLRYQRRRSADQVLRARRREIAEAKRRYSCPRIYVRLRRQGWKVKDKKVERIYREEGLSLRRGLERNPLPSLVLRCRCQASPASVMR